MEHSKGLLKFGGVHSWEIFAMDDGVSICTIHAAEPWQDGLLNVKHERTIAKANAQHLVACWNGCEGINPDAVRGLLIALKAIKDRLTHKGDHGQGDVEGAVRWASAAIAKAKGK
ncbi:hypothetical protein LCGC14_1815080 [marine sediment metagenome]|uniref:Uncharacterized protein n=1 Tax=marine sediment metagenome TaxID=412755 RepID=A0A0F9H8R3_9ZZZZ